MTTVYKLALAGVLVANFASGQILDPANTAKRKATNRANSRIDQSIDKGFDKAEEGIGNLFRKKPRNKEEDIQDNPDKGTAPTVVTAGADKGEVISQRGETQATPANFKTYSKFDFIPGEKVIGVEDFSQDAIGDFPAKWNTDGSGEVVTLASREGKWLKFSDEGTFYPEFVPVLPENATIEFELGVDEAHQVLTMLRFVDSKLYPTLLGRHYANRVTVIFNPLGITEILVNNAEDTEILTNRKETGLWRIPEKPFVKISVWKQKSRLRVYMDEVKMWDIPRAFQPGADYRMIFETSTFYVQNREVLLSDLRVASGLPDTRSKLLTEGKFVTTGILFDTNSDVIKPASYAVLKEIGQTLSENPNVKIRITGHTDSQGDDKTNLALSAKRAVSVKNALVANWKIDSGRIETDGHGETKP
jgi:OOP family OmpA-OmpF porin